MSKSIAMRKVKIENSDFRHKGKIIKEGTITDLPQDEVENHSSILIPVADEPKSAAKSKKKTKGN